MNKYLVLFMSFLLSLMFVLYEDNSEVREGIKFYDCVDVFNDVVSDYKVVSNPDTSDINIYYYFVLLFYSFMVLICLVFDMKKINKYMM